MKRPLLTHESTQNFNRSNATSFGSIHTSARKMNKSYNIFSIITFLLLGAVVSFAQPSINIAPGFGCVCLDNASSPNGSDGQFNNTISILGENNSDTWTVVTAVGLYLDSSPNPPALPLPILAGDEVPLIGGTTYGFVTRSINDQPYYLEVSNGDTTLVTEGLCAYPTPEILGSPFVCGLSEIVYSVDQTLGHTYSWSLNDGGMITSNTNTSSVTVQWDEEAGGPYFLTVTETDTYGCSRSDILSIYIEDLIVMACNNFVNLALNENCEVAVMADMFLEDMSYDNESYTIRISDEDGNVLPDNVVNGDYLNQTLNVSVIHDCGGNSCWGYLIVEDKSIPQLMCGSDTIPCESSIDPFDIGFPIPNTAQVSQSGPNTYTVTGFDFCGPAELSYYDIVLEHFCHGEFSTTIYRDWTFTDASGNSSFCQDTIETERAEVTGTTFPEDYDGFQNPALEACGDWIELPNGHPSPESTGYPSVASCFNVLVEYHDVNIPICDNNPKTFKIYRTWIVTDVCADIQLQSTQLIKVEDDERPVVTCPLDNIIAGTNPGTCEGDVTLPLPIIIFECSDWTYTVGYLLADENGDPPVNGQYITDSNVVYNPDDNTYTILNLPSGRTWIRYTIVDLCGNTTQCFTEVDIVDDEEPVPVCDQHVTVALGNDGIGKAGWESFNDGSWDNCEIDRIEIKRMIDGPCGQENVWTDLLKFCCEDVGEVIMVQMRVTDLEGYSNTCMVEVAVQDNHPPVIDCPPHLTVDCDSDFSDLSIYGEASYFDNCSAEITVQENFFLNDCGLGTIRRTFTATDPGGLTDQCTQILYVESLDRFNEFDIIWPNDYIFSGCIDTDVHPDNLPPAYGNPILNDKPCSNVAATYDDIVFQFVDNACFKILRQWTVIDWCHFNQNNPSEGNGIWHYTQVIKVNNNSAPQFTQGCNNIVIGGNQLNDCTTLVDLTAIATDDCTGESGLKYTYQIDRFNDGSINSQGHSNMITKILPLGTHKVYWTAEDQCGNVTSCSQLVTIVDEKAPTPICHSGIVTVLMENNNSVEIWASDFDKGSWDACGSVVASFSESTSDQSRTFTCDDLNGNVLDTIELRIYITDESGNQDFCTTSIIIQDNMNVCGNATVTTAEVAGRVFSEDHEMVDEVQVMMMAEMPEYPIFDMTEEGSYSFDELEVFQDYHVEPSKDEDYLNGVSTLDLILIQKHILGIQSLDSPYKIIAADINASENVSAIDLVQLRKLILGFYDELPSNESWRFVNADFEFANESNPFPFEEKVDLISLSNDQMDVDFIGVKVGDVNNSAELSNALSSIVRNNESAQFVANSKSYRANETITVEVEAGEDMTIEGFQMTIRFDDNLRFESLNSKEILMNESNIGIKYLNQGLIQISWDDINAPQINKGDVLFSLEFSSRANGELMDDLSMINHTFNSEVYMATSNDLIDSKNLELVWRSEDDNNLEGQFELFQNIPNPFSNTTNIGFRLPESGIATLSIFDVNGRLLYQNSSNYSKGYNSIEIKQESIKESGLLYYQLETNSHTRTKKMIVIK